ncbi:hypothetical protein FKM82_018251 [Ascaphus truei]
MWQDGEVNTVFSENSSAVLVAADALKCHKMVCPNVSTCTYSIETCDSGLNHCIFLVMDDPKFLLLQGCISESICLQMKSFEPSTRCCTSDLCNNQ